MTATGCGSPYETEKESGWKSGTVRPTTETGLSGVCTDFAAASASGTLRRNSSWMSASLSGKVKPWPPAQSASVHSSFGSRSTASSQVDISGVMDMTFRTFVMCPSSSPLVV